MHNVHSVQTLLRTITTNPITNRVLCVFRSTRVYLSCRKKCLVIEKIIVYETVIKLTLKLVAPKRIQINTRSFNELKTWALVFFFGDERRSHVRRRTSDRHEIRLTTLTFEHKSLLARIFLPVKRGHDVNRATGPCVSSCVFSELIFVLL